MTAVHIPYMYYTKFHCTYKLDPSCLLLPGVFFFYNTSDTQLQSYNWHSHITGNFSIHSSHIGTDDEEKLTDDK